MSHTFTKSGLELRRRQIARLEKKLREIGHEVGAEAGDNCDWHDNFGYEDAKRRLELEAANLQRLQDEIASASVVDVVEQAEKVAIGTTVRVLSGGVAREYTIGGFGESDPDGGLLSYQTPLARPILGMKVGDSRVISVAGREVEIEVVEILPPTHKYHQVIARLLESMGSV